MNDEIVNCIKCGKGFFNVVEKTSKAGNRYRAVVCANCKEFMSFVTMPVSKEKAHEVVFKFGKHKDKTIEEVASEDQGYIEWAADNLSDKHVARACQLYLGDE